MKKYLIFLLIILKAFSQESDENVYISPEFKSDTLFSINGDTLNIVVERKVDKQSKVSSESYSDDGTKITMYYLDNYFKLSFNKNSQKILEKDFHKNDFAEVCGSEYLSDKILYSFVFETFNTKENLTEFSVSLYKPDTDVGCEILFKLFEDGSFKIFDNYN